AARGGAARVDAGRGGLSGARTRSPGMSRILVVEDNRDLAYGLRNNLEIEGYDVVVAEDGAAGLAAARDRALDLVTLDPMLPAMGGFRVLPPLPREGGHVPLL